VPLSGWMAEWSKRVSDGDRGDCSMRRT